MKKINIKYVLKISQGLLKIIAVVIILALTNFLAFVYFQPLDLTENQLFTLSPQTQQILKNLSQPLKVWLFETQGSPADIRLLEQYHSYSSYFQFEVVNPDVNFSLAQKFGVKSSGEIYLNYGSKKQRLEKTNPQDYLTEEQLTNSIVAIVRDPHLPIYFLKGHGEPPLDDSQGGFSQAIANLKGQGYEIKTLNLAQTRSSIPKDANVIIIAGAVRPLLPAEIKAVKDYLDQGGKLLLMQAPRTTLGLEGILKTWGVELDNRLVVDASGFGTNIGYGPATVIITDYGNHPITVNFGGGISLYPMTRAISTTKKDNIQAIALLITDDRTWAESNLSSLEAEYNPKQDIKGPLDIGVALKRTQSQGNKTIESRVVVFGNATFATNGWFEQQLNGDVFTNSVGWLAKEELQTLTIGPKEPKNRRLYLDSRQVQLIFWLALGVVPFLGFSSAAVVWFIRR